MVPRFQISGENNNSNAMEKQACTCTPNFFVCIKFVDKEPTIFFCEVHGGRMFVMNS